MFVACFILYVSQTPWLSNDLAPTFFQLPPSAPVRLAPIVGKGVRTYRRWISSLREDSPYVSISCRFYTHTDQRLHKVADVWFNYLITCSSVVCTLRCEQASAYSLLTRRMLRHVIRLSIIVDRDVEIWKSVKLEIREPANTLKKWRRSMNSTCNFLS